MPVDDRAEETRWLTLQQASERLAVHPSTLRNWADQGKLPVYRTPGGHRRFVEQDVEAFWVATHPSQPAHGVQMVVESALGRTHLAIAAGRLQEEAWYQHYDEETKQQHRRWGRQLFRLLILYLSQPQERKPILDEVFCIGQQNGELAHRQGLTLSQAVQAFLFFSNTLQQAIVRGQQLAANLEGIHGQLNAFLDQVLLGVVRTYEQEALSYE
jgi:excisionase family DNA binding protein